MFEKDRLIKIFDIIIESATNKWIFDLTMSSERPEPDPTNLQKNIKEWRKVPVGNNKLSIVGIYKICFCNDVLFKAN